MTPEGLTVDVGGEQVRAGALRCDVDRRPGSQRRGETERERPPLPFASRPAPPAPRTGA